MNASKASCLKGFLIATTMALWPCIAAACAIITPTVGTGTGFRVRVMNGERPVRGLRLALTLDQGRAGKEPPTYEQTDSDGYAQFASVNPGDYFLAADIDSGHGDWVEVRVSRHDKRVRTILLKWPSGPVIRVRSVNGTMHAPNFYPAQTQPALSISLLDGPSAQLIATTYADGRGNFHFDGALPAGLYFLRVNPSGVYGWDGSAIGGLVSIAIDPAAEQTSLALDLGWTSCGLSYAQQVVEREIQVKQVCGDIADQSGGEISDADVMLVADDDHTKILEKARAERGGRFALLDTPPGTYQLEIVRLGFQPFLQTLQVEPGGPTASCEHPIHVKMGVPR